MDGTPSGLNNGGRANRVDLGKRDPQRTGPSQGSVFDYELALSRLGGDRELFDEVLGMFLEDAPILLEQAATSLANDDMPTLQRATHTLKGLSANFAAAAAVAAAYAVELRAGGQQRDRAAQGFPQMEAEVHRLEDALREFREQRR